MPNFRKLVTLHAPIAQETAEAFVAPVIDLMEKFGFPWHIGPASGDLAALLNPDKRDLCLFVDCPQVWHERGPTRTEMAHFYELWESGDKAAAQAFAQVGFPKHLR